MKWNRNGTAEEENARKKQQLLQKFQYEQRSSVNMFDIWIFVRFFFTIILQTKRFGSPLLILKLNTWNFWANILMQIARKAFQENIHSDSTLYHSSRCNLKRHRLKTLLIRCTYHLMAKFHLYLADIMFVVGIYLSALEIIISNKKQNPHVSTFSMFQSMKIPR